MLASNPQLGRSPEVNSSSSTTKVVADDFERPGHVFPLRANNGGVLNRRGHTEAALDLARLSGHS